MSSAKTVECVPWVPAIQGQEMIRATRVPSSKLVCFVHSLCLQQQQGRSVMVSCALLWELSWPTEVVGSNLYSKGPLLQGLQDGSVLAVQSRL